MTIEQRTCLKKAIINLRLKIFFSENVESKRLLMLEKQYNDLLFLMQSL